MTAPSSDDKAHNQKPKHVKTNPANAISTPQKPKKGKQLSKYRRNVKSRGYGIDDKPVSITPDSGDASSLHSSRGSIADIPFNRRGGLPTHIKYPNPPSKETFPENKVRYNRIYGYCVMRNSELIEVKMNGIGKWVRR